MELLVKEFGAGLRMNVIASIRISFRKSWGRNFSALVLNTGGCNQAEN
jgi:hypothetical protein